MKVITKIRENCGKTDGTLQPLNVAIVGFYGAGKSSLINTIAAGFRGCWQEHAMCGSFGTEEAKHVTVRLESYVTYRQYH